jgi:hypothetical protein
MANGLTGDFDFVVEVSDATLDRLAATMHQNGFSDPAKPSLPHLAYFRVGGIDGERGSVAAQVGVPHVVLIDGATDRFWVEIGFRARYRADPGSTPLADVVHGTIRAMYRFQDIDPNCAGWHAIADDYLWLRLVDGSVSFDGTAYFESALPEVLLPSAEQRIKQHITTYLAGLLAGQFEPSTPHPIGTQHRLRRFRTLSHGSAQGSSGVAIPFGLENDTPPGELESIKTLFLDGHDFALAVSTDYVLGAVQSQLDPFIGSQRDFHIHGDAGVAGGLEIDYHARIDAMTAQWLGPAPFLPHLGVIKITAAGTGWASRLYRSGVYNLGSGKASDLAMSVSVDQFLMLHFDQSGQRIAVSAMGQATVSVSYNGPFSGEIIPTAKAAVGKYVDTLLAGALGKAQDEVNAFSAPDMTSALVDALQTVDAAAVAWFDDAIFRVEGLVLRGTIRLSPRHSPEVSFVKTPAGDGFDAIDSWIPGGRIDSFEWTWRWFTNPVEAPLGPPGATSQIDSYQLRRPHGSRTRFGLTAVPDRPLPGLDGQGRICLSVKGVHVDPVSGARVPVQSVVDCAQFGYEFKMPVEVGPYVAVCDPLGGRPGVTAPEVGVMRVGASRTTEATQNTLILYLGEAWNGAAVEVLTSALDACRRRGAGLLVLLLFRRDALHSADSQLAAQIRHLGVALPAPLLVIEDLRDSWSEYLGVDTSSTDLQWRLLTPVGAVSWLHRGPLDSEELRSVLDKLLVASHPAGLVPFRPESRIGDRITINLTAGDCPPIPLRRPGTPGSKVVFVDNSHALVAAREALHRAPAGSDETPYIAVIVDGATAEDARALATHLGPDVPVFGDPDGALTRNAGVRFTPTVLTLDALGTLRDVPATPDLLAGVRRAADETGS